MKMGENSTFNFQGEQFIKDGCSHDSIKADTKLILEMELAKITDYNKPKWELNAQERLSYALQQKEDGNAAFKEKNFKLASEKY